MFILCHTHFNAPLLKQINHFAAPPASASHAPHERHAPQVQAFASNRRRTAAGPSAPAVSGHHHSGVGRSQANATEDLRLLGGRFRFTAHIRGNQMEQVNMVKSLTYPFQLNGVLITITGSWQGQHCSLSCTGVTKCQSSSFMNQSESPAELQKIRLV